MIEFDIDGKKRGLKFGTYTFQIINELTGTTTVQEVFDELKKGMPGFATAFYFACAKHYAMSKKQPIDFEQVDVADWMDELGTDKVAEITGTLFHTYLQKNLPAPMTGQSTDPESVIPQLSGIGKPPQ